MGLLREGGAYHDQFIAIGVEGDGVAVADTAIEDGAGDAVLNFALDDTLERASTKLRIVAFGGEQIFGSLGKLERDMAIYKTPAQTIDLDLDDLSDLAALERMEDNHLVDAVDELGTEALFAQLLTDLALHFVFVHTVQCG